jgi:hypothetical protein
MNNRLKPGHFPLGSPESRAMARSQLERAEWELAQVLRIRAFTLDSTAKGPCLNYGGFRGKVA